MSSLAPTSSRPRFPLPELVIPGQACYNKISYDARGKVLSQSGTLASVNPLRYRGYYYDKETGLYYLQSRYYDPVIGRFINADDAGTLGANGEILSYNLFAYCLNNPVNRTDDGGNLSWLGKIAVGLAVIAVVAVVAVATAGTGTVLACAAAGALEGAITGAATGAVTGAAMGAISHRVSTGSWEGAGKAALEGAADGFMTGAISGAITGAITSPYCFVAGTLVETGEGPKPIEEIQPGDWVWAWDEETGEVALRPVMETYVNETDELVHVFVNGEEIISTPGHPFYSPVKGWTDAVHLRAGDILVLVNGEYVVVEKIQHELLEAPIHVYNFNVAGFHTYYVTGSGVLVHNSHCGGRARKQAKLRDLANDDKLPSYLRGEIKQDINAINRGTRTTIRVPKGYNLAHRNGFPAKLGYSYDHSFLDTIAGHRLHHHVFGYK